MILSVKFCYTGCTYRRQLTDQAFLHTETVMSESAPQVQLTRPILPKSFSTSQLPCFSFVGCRRCDYSVINRTRSYFGHGVLKTHFRCTEMLCVREIWFWCAVSLKRIAGPFLFEDSGGEGSILSIYCRNYKLFISFCYPSNMKK